MKICQVLLSRGHGGLEKHVAALANQLAINGEQVSVIAGSDFLATLPEQIHKHPVPVHLGRLNPYLLYRIWRLIKHIQPQIIHAQANKAAAVISLLNSWLPGICLGTLHNMKRRVDAFTRLDHVITVSQQLATRFRADEVTVVYNGTAVTAPQKMDLLARFSLPASQPVLCAAGRLVPAKGFDLLLKAIDGLPVSLLIAGEGPQRPLLEKQIAQLSINTTVRLIGYQPQLTDLLANADAVLISSRREGFSYVFNEALLLGRPILSMNVPVANEFLPAALICQQNDPQLFRQQLVTLLADPEHWSAMMKVPRQKAQQRLQLSAMVDNTQAVYQRLTEHHD